MDEPKLQITKRRLPHWTLEGSVYFVTFRSARGNLSERERQMVLDHIRNYQTGLYDLGAAVVMPDHVHLLLMPRPGVTLSRIMKGIKGASAHKLNQSRDRTGQVWQDESWDRIIRDEAELQEKLQYMLHNPVKAGLVKTPDDYPACYFNPAFC